MNVDKKGRLWNGLSYFDEKENKWTFTYPELQKAFPKLKDIEYTYANLIFDEQNRMLVQVNRHRQFIRYDFERHEGKSYQTNGSPFKGLNDRFYVNSPNGFNLYDPVKDHFDLITEKDGLTTTGVFHIKEDDRGFAWIANSNGLQKFDPNTRSFTNIDFTNGFPSKERTVVRHLEKDRDGYIYFDIDLKKVARFHPDSLIPNLETTSVRLLDFYLNRKPALPNDTNAILQKNLRYTKSINLNYDQADFGFSFAMPVYYKSKDIEYFYRLSPYQKEWQSNGISNEFHYTNISPGSYIFEVKAKTADGVWNTKNASVNITVYPPWWKTWWAYSLYALLFFAAVYGVYRFNLNRQYEKQEAFRLKELDTLKSRLYTNITHEFRTPLTVIMGIADNLRGNQQERNLIRRNSKNLLRLINQLLDLSKLDSGTMQMDVVQGDIINYLRYLTESFYSMAQEKEIGLTFNTAVEQLEMDFDEVKVQHIIYNLLSNALKFTKENGTVQIHTSQKTRNDQPFLHIKVQDTGVGISPEQLPHVFDRFYQADNTTTRKGEGTGIGLALTKELVQMMDGTIEAKSQIGKGTLFTILLPIKKAAATSLMEKEFLTAQTIAPELVPDQFETNTDGLASANEDLPHLLLIEDNKDVATYIQSLLKNQYQVTIAPNGQKGIDQALETIPDIIITDVMMPEKVE